MDSISFYITLLRKAAKHCESETHEHKRDAREDHQHTTVKQRTNSQPSVISENNKGHITAHQQ